VESYGKLPLSFEVNLGQTDKRVKFLSRGSGYSLFLTTNEAVLVLKKPECKAVAGSHLESAVPSIQESVPPGYRPASFNATALPWLLRSGAEGFDINSIMAIPKLTVSDLNPQASAVLRMKLVGANSGAKVIGLKELPGKSNYFIGNDPKKWCTNVPNYAKVKYVNVYPGVDLVYYGKGRQLEYDFVVQPGADPSQIALDLGAALVDPGGPALRVPVRIDQGGDLIIGPDDAEVMLHKPAVYQSSAESRLRIHHERQAPKDKHFIEAKYVLKGSRLSFDVTRYDRTKPLVIDPALAYSTYLGGSGNDFGRGIAVDASGNAYVTGVTDSSNFPTTAGAFQITFARGTADAFVSKINAGGSALLYTTYLGGSGGDSATAIAIDASGNAYITGGTESPEFPITAGAFQTTCPQCDGQLFGDAFVTKLNGTGSALLYSTYLGGTRDFNVGGGIATDTSGNAYVPGGTDSSDFPITPGAFQTIFGGVGSKVGFGDGFVTKLNAAGSALVYSTFLGGNGDEDFLLGGIAVDTSGDAYVTGDTDSSNFPTTAGAFQSTIGGDFDAFVSKLSANGSALLYSTYLGGSDADLGKSIAIDASGNAYVTGGTSSLDFPATQGALQTNCGGSASFCSNAFITKLNVAGSAPLYSTYLGGSGFDRCLSIFVSASGDAFGTGGTSSTVFPTTAGAFQSNFSSCVSLADVFITKLNPAGSALFYSTYLGGSGDDGGSGVAVDASGNAYVTGGTFSSDFPTTADAFQTAFGGAQDAFISKFSFGVPFSNFGGKLELNLNSGSFDLNATFTLGPGGSINPPTQPVSLTIGTYSVTIPAGSFVRHKPGYAFEGVINRVSLEVLIKFGGTPGSYRLLAQGEGANLIGTVNPVIVKLSIGDNTGTTQINAQFQ